MLVQMTCDGCGASFERYRGRRKPGHKVYCSDTCRRVGVKRGTAGAPYTRTTYSKTHVCAYPPCEKSFIAEHPARKYCNDGCRLAGVRDRSQALWKTRAVVPDALTPAQRKLTKHALLTKQRSCAICGRSFETMNLKQIHVDHDHATGAIRELLCFKCNAGLGQFGDSVATLHSAMTYLQRHAVATERSLV